jgi:cation diffusion facilitator family transporter
MEGRDGYSVTERTREGVFVTLVGLGVNGVLTAGKYAAGILGRSGAMIADATHSLSDILTDVVVLLGLGYTCKPADEEHAYGHGRVETLTAAFCGLVLLIAGLGIFFKGIADILRVVQGETLPRPGRVALYGAAGSIVLKELLFRYTFAKGRAIDSASLRANAWHHRSDALSSMGALLGIGGSLAGGERWAVLDPAAAVAVSAFVLYAAASLFWDSVREVLDTSLGASRLDWIGKTALAFPEIFEIHQVRTRKIGFYVAVEAHILRDGRLSLKRAHDVASALEEHLRAVLGRNALITLHTEPYGEENGHA